MVATYYAPIVEREVAQVRVRLARRGKLILQVRHRQEKLHLFADPEDAGMGPWRDADARRPDVLAQALRLMPAND